MIAKNKNLQPVKDYFANLDIDKETVYKIITENLSDLTDLLKMYAEQL